MCTVFIGMTSIKREVFSGYVYETVLDDISVTLTFDGHFMNNNNNFNIQTGIYTCPTDGVYAFHDVMTSPEFENALIDVRDSRVLSARATTNGAYSYILQSANMAVFWCEKDTEISLITPWLDSFSIIGDENMKVNTFTGFRICK